MSKKEKAIGYFRDQFNCSQAVFSVFGTENGLTEDQCLKTACGFGGGMGKQQMTCGALSGAIMALGLKYGKTIGDSEEKKAETYALTRKLFSEFTKLNGAVSCRELLDGLNMNDPAEYERIKALRLFELKCEKYVADAVAITESLFNKE